MTQAYSWVPAYQESRGRYAAGLEDVLQLLLSDVSCDEGLWREVRGWLLSASVRCGEGQYGTWYSHLEKEDTCQKSGRDIDCGASTPRHKTSLYVFLYLRINS